MSSTRKRVLVTGGAGFLGSHLCERLVSLGLDVLCVDNYFTGRKDNVAELLACPQFEAMRHDICFPLYVEVDEMPNLACPPRRSTTSTIRCRPRRPACPAPSTCWAWPSACARKSSRPRPRRSMATPRSIRRPRITAATSTRSARARATTKASAAPRPCSSTISASTGSASVSPASSTPMGRACTRTTGASCRTSSSRR